jgi:hypothetical protein
MTSCKGVHIRYLGLKSSSLSSMQYRYPLYHLNRSEMPCVTCHLHIRTGGKHVLHRCPCAIGLLPRPFSGWISRKQIAFIRSRLCFSIALHFCFSAMDKVPSPQTVETPLSWSHITGAPSDAPPSEVEKSEQQSPPAKRRKEDKERTRVSRACDRCKKYEWCASKISGAPIATIRVTSRLLTLT